MVGALSDLLGIIEGILLGLYFIDGSQLLVERLVPDSHLTRVCGLNLSSFMGVNPLVL